MTSGGQCVISAGTGLMLLWSANSWDMHTLEVSANASIVRQSYYHLKYLTCVTGGTPYYNAFFGVGTGPIYLNYVACTLSASQLLECSSRPILSHNCDHRADAGVRCEGKVLCQNLKRKSNCLSTIYFIYVSLQLLAQLVNCDWLEVTFQMRAEWRSV